MQSFLQDLRSSWRKMTGQPLLATVVVLCVALGIASTTTVYGVLRGALLRPFIFPQPEKLMLIWVSLPELQTRTEVVSGPEYLALEEMNDVFAAIGAGIGASVTFAAEEQGDPLHLRGMGVLPGLFPTLGVEPTLGRWLLAEDGKEGAPETVVLSYDVWQSAFGGDPELIGRTVYLSEEPHTVVGVMPPRFRFGRSDFWAPLATDRLAGFPRSQRFLWTVVRLHDTVSRKQADAALEVLARKLEEEHGGVAPEYARWQLLAEPLGEVFAGEIKTGLRLLLGAAVFVLLIVCANVANLLLARTFSREREIATRIAFGARRWDVARQLLTESLVPVTFGGLLGLAFTAWAVKGVAALIPEQYLPAAAWFGVEATTVGVAFALTVATALAVGLLPALRSTRPDLHDSLKQGGRSGAVGRRGRRTLGLMVVAETAAALLLATGFGLMYDGFLRLQERHPGFDAEDVLTFHLDLPRERYDDTRVIADFYDRFERRLAALPGVEAVGAVRRLPLGDFISPVTTFALAGQEGSDDSARETVFLAATPGYFRALKVALHAGRPLSEQDRGDSLPVAVVNQRFVRRFLAGQDPLGQQIRIGNPRLGDSWRTVVGVVGDVKQQRLTEEVQPAVYIPNLQMPGFGLNSMGMALRSPLDADSLVPALRRELDALDPRVPIFDVEPLSDAVASSLGGWRLCVVLLTVLAAVAIFLAALGLFGVVSFSVARRAGEIGIRTALGARHRDILTMILRQGMTLVSMGVLGGAVGGFFLARYLTTLALEVRVGEPATYVAVAVFLLAVSFVACAVPAWQAAHRDPVNPLREE